MREEIIQKGFEKAKKAYDEMMNVDTTYDTKKRVKISNKLTLEFNCIRELGKNEDDEPLYRSRSVVSVEIYAIVNGKDVDGITVDLITGSIDADLMYLLKCYI